MDSGKVRVRSYAPFHKTAEGLLSAGDIQEIELILGNDPFVGEALEGSDGTFVFVYKNVEIHYGITEGLDIVVLLIAKPKDDDQRIDPKDDDQRIDPKKINKKLGKTGKKWLGREIYYRIREWIKDNWPEDWDPGDWF